MWWLGLCWEKNSLLTGSSFISISLPPVLCPRPKPHFMGGFECLTQAFLRATSVPLNFIPHWEWLGNSSSKGEAENLFGFDEYKSLFLWIQANLTLSLSKMVNREQFRDKSLAILSILNFGLCSKNRKPTTNAQVGRPTLKPAKEIDFRLRVILPFILVHVYTCLSMNETALFSDDWPVIMNEEKQMIAMRFMYLHVRLIV